VGSPEHDPPQQAKVALNHALTTAPTRRRSHPSANGGRRRERGVALFGVSILLSVAGLLAGCGTPTSSGPSNSSGAIALPTNGTTLDGGNRLAAVLGQLANGYSFTTTVSVGGQVATKASGRWIAGGSEFTVTTNGVAITYRTLPPRSWVLQSGAGWVEVNGTVPSGSPLDALKAPSQTTVVAQSTDMVELTASYPAAVLGLAGTNTVAVDLVLAADGSLKATYATTAGSATAATSATTIAPDPSQAPIVVPSPS
jgi:hypothetical protein